MEEPSVQCTVATGGRAGLDVVANIIVLKFGDLRVHLIATEIVVFDISGKNGCVSIIIPGRVALNRSCSAGNCLHFCVFERLIFHVPIRAAGQECLGPCNLRFVSGVVLPLVSVVVDVIANIPEWYSVVVNVIVCID